jgi:hypothetical protein
MRSSGVSECSVNIVHKLLTVSRASLTIMWIELRIAFPLAGRYFDCICIIRSPCSIETARRKVSTLHLDATFRQ